MITTNTSDPFFQKPNQGIFSHSYEGFTLKSDYHKSTIEQNKKIIDVSVKVVYIGIFIIFIGVFAAFLGKTSTAIVTCTSGVITEAISNIAFWLVGKEMEEKLKYFSSLALDEERDIYIGMVERMENAETKDKMIEKLVDNYCARRVQNSEV